MKESREKSVGNLLGPILRHPGICFEGLNRNTKDLNPDRNSKRIFSELRLHLLSHHHLLFLRVRFIMTTETRLDNELMSFALCQCVVQSNTVHASEGLLLGFQGTQSYISRLLFVFVISLT